MTLNSLVLLNFEGLYLKKKKSSFEFLPRQKVKAKSIILRFTPRFRMVTCCTERQIEAMLLTLISKGGEDLEHFKRFQRLVPGLEKSREALSQGTVTNGC